MSRHRSLALALALALLAGACDAAPGTICADGRACPDGTACYEFEPDTYGCLPAAQIEDCIDKAEGNACSFPGVPSGLCRDGLCQPPESEFCGNGELDDGEVCDDGNLLDGDGCAGDCLSFEACGDRIVSVAVGEQCDDGNHRSHDGCSSRCLEETPIWSAGAVLPIGAGGELICLDAFRKQLLVRADLAVDGRTTEWDGHHYVERHPPPIFVAPPTADFECAFDPHKKVLVVVGGFPDRAVTLEWDGYSWRDRTPLLPEVSPAFAEAGRPLLVYDAGRRVLVFLGAVDFQDTHDVWERQGDSWTRLESSNGARVLRAAAYDPRSGVTWIFGEKGGGERALWTWDGASWQEAWSSPDTGPALSGTVHMAWDPRQERLVLIGKVDQETSWVSWQWSLKEEAWSPLPGTGAMGNSIRWRLTMGPDGRLLTLAAGYPFVLELRKNQWQGRPVAGPVARHSYGVSYDSDRGVVVLFGGNSTAGYEDETWEWDGRRWKQALPGLAPSPRTRIPMAYDPVRKRTLLFGGSAIAGITRETWEWDGTSWEQRVDGPNLASYAARLAFDPALDGIRLVGAVDPDLGASFVWDGTQWKDRSPDALLPGFLGSWDHNLIHDRSSGEVLWTIREGEKATFWRWTLAGFEATPVDQSFAYGDTAYSPLRDEVTLFNGVTWERHGDTWSSHYLSQSPDGPEQQLLHDASGRVIALTDATTDPSAVGEGIHWLDWQDGLPQEACHSGVDLDGDALVGCDDPDCWIYCAPECPTGENCPADAPHCGDGTCTPSRESCRLCPSDCGACPERCGDHLCDAGESAASCPGDCSP